MSLVQCGGVDVIRGEIHMPLRGVWWANLRLDTQTAPALKASANIAAADGLSITGSYTKTGIFNDQVYVHVVGGAGGVGVSVGPFAYQSCVLGDPLNAVLSAARESLSPTVSTNITRMRLPTWTSTQRHAARLIDELCWAAQQQLGSPVNWRMASDGTVWMGTEQWSSLTLPPGSDVVMQHPVGPWFEIACETPSLMPGVNLTDIGNLNVAGVDHWIGASQIRTWAWTES